MGAVAGELLTKKGGAPETENASFLSTLVMCDVLSHIDLFFVDHFLPADGLEEQKAFFAFMMLTARSGHLCVRIEEEKILPSPSEFCPCKELAIQWHKAILEGVKKLPSTLCSEEHTVRCSAKPLYQWRQYYYLQKNWVLESRFLESLQPHIQEKKKVFAEETTFSPLLNKEQKSAVCMALSNSLSVITGGPGTGKTFTAVEIVRSFLASHPNEKDVSIVLAAPTGKAAFHLQNNIKRSLLQVENIVCGTIHSLFGIRNTEDLLRKDKPFFADLLIIDECSMLDVRLFAFLLFSLQKGGKIVLMGDKDQLPPVDAGSLFADLVALSSSSSLLPCTVLTECLRSDKKEILSLATAIRESNYPMFQRSLELHEGRSVENRNLGLGGSHVRESYELIWQQCKDFFPFPSSKIEAPETLLKSLETFRILSCIRKGPFGVDAINRMMIEKMSAYTLINGYFAIPILITKNDYEQELFNGEVGVLIRRGKYIADRLFHEEDEAYFTDKDPVKPMRKISASLLPAFEYAYCLSVHKSQGSEYDKVLILAPEGAESFGKEVLYTAVTRAKKHVVLSGKDSVFKQTIERSSRKLSGICARLVI